MSNIGDGWSQTFPDQHPWYPRPEDPVEYPRIPTKIKPVVWPSSPNTVTPQDLEKLATKAEIEALRKEMVELKELLKAAIKFDKATNQPHCEVEDKMKLIKQVATAVGVDLSDLDLND